MMKRDCQDPWQDAAEGRGSIAPAERSGKGNSGLAEGWGKDGSELQQGMSKEDGEERWNLGSGDEARRRRREQLNKHRLERRKQNRQQQADGDRWRTVSAQDHARPDTMARSDGVVGVRKMDEDIDKGPRVEFVDKVDAVSEELRTPISGGKDEGVVMASRSQRIENTDGRLEEGRAAVPRLEWLEMGDVRSGEMRAIMPRLDRVEKSDARSEEMRAIIPRLDRLEKVESRLEEGKAVMPRVDRVEKVDARLEEGRALMPRMDWGEKGDARSEEGRGPAMPIIVPPKGGAGGVLVIARKPEVLPVTPTTASATPKGESRMCHQCNRVDKPTIFKCKTCKRYRYCGGCIRNRYQSLTEKEVEDKCPMCRDICNCGHCRDTKRQPRLPPARKGKRGREHVLDLNVSTHGGLDEPGGLDGGYAMDSPMQNVGA
eukprot:TRINITY_DN2834_c0_g1_i1.p1 TRINITY_DN2834_c0_g1~~TRINITY_DN2834_c0_g1_i1.p1  ORF type:complete len:430 (+),score=95.49 TRINITY_DN2834_c0_g1_i1:309-1598(+)